MRAESNMMDEFEMYRAQAYNYSPHHNRSKSLPPRRRKRNTGEDSARGGSLREQSPLPARVASVKTPRRRKPPEPVEIRHSEHEPSIYDNNLEPLSPVINRLRLEEAYLQDPGRVLSSSTEMRPHTLDIEPPSPTPSYDSRHRRAYSCRKSRSPRVEAPGDVIIRPRTSSLPSRKDSENKEPCVLTIPTPGDDVPEDLPTGVYRVRSFQTTSKGIVNRGDSFKRRSRSSRRSTTSGSSAGMDTESSGEREGAGGGSAVSFPAVFDESPGPQPYRVLVMGSSDVGKTALTTQFMTSEYMGHVDTAKATESERTVSVVLDGEESMICFIDHADHKGAGLPGPADAYVIVYSLVDYHSLDVAVSLLRRLQRDESRDSTAVILVGNKSDIVRGREVPDGEARKIAMKFGCKHIEVSAVLNHNIDELLVGTLRQIRLNKRAADQGTRAHDAGCATSGGGCVQAAARGLIHKLLKKSNSGSKSCDNLMEP